MHKLNIDGGGGAFEGWSTFCPSVKHNGMGGASTSHSNYIVIQRFFERLKDPHLFLREFYHFAMAGTELFLYSMDHDGVQQFIGGGKNNLIKAFGADYEAEGCWLRKFNSVQEVINIFEEYGWVYDGTFEEAEGMPTPEYPHHRLKFHMPRVQCPWQYVLHDVPIDPYWKVIDIGPGNFPWPRANAYLEHPHRLHNPAYSKDKLPDPTKIVWGDIQEYNGVIPDKYYDFAFCSHIFEHLPNPSAAARELSRIAKRGIIVVPSAYKDALCFWDESEHLWDCYYGHDGRLTMFKRDQEWLANIKDKHMQSAMNRLFHGDGNFETTDHRYARKWFRDHEKDLDVIIPWEGAFDVQVI